MLVVVLVWCLYCCSGGGSSDIFPIFHFSKKMTFLLMKKKQKH